MMQSTMTSAAKTMDLGLLTKDLRTLMLLAIKPLKLLMMTMRMSLREHLSLRTISQSSAMQKVHVCTL